MKTVIKLIDIFNIQNYNKQVIRASLLFPACPDLILAKGTVMKVFETIRSKRLLSVVTAMFILAVILFSSIYIVAEAHHDCSDHDNCPICTTIQMCENILHHLGNCAVICISLAIAAFFFIFFMSLHTGEISYYSPVSEKVRLNN